MGCLDGHDANWFGVCIRLMLVKGFWLKVTAELVCMPDRWPWLVVNGQLKRLTAVSDYADS